MSRPETIQSASTTERDLSSLAGTAPFWRRPSWATVGALVLGLVGVGAGLALPPEFAPAPLPTLLPALGAAALFAAGLNHLLVAGGDLPPVVAQSLVDARVADAAARLGGDPPDAARYLPADGATGPRLVAPPASGAGADAQPSPGEGTLEPSAATLYRAFEAQRSGDPDPRPEAIVAALCDALAGGFELVADARIAVVADNRARVAVEGTVLPDLARFDHPVASFLGVGLATELDRPVTVDVEVDEEVAADAVVVCRWTPDSAQ